MLAGDSNLDWNHALPEVRRFAEERGIPTVLLDEFGFSEAEVYVPQARLWNCQLPAATDGNAWAVVSAGMILDGHNCSWLLQYPHEPLAGGSMYAFQLPRVIPAAGAPGGPPRREAFRNFGGLPGDIEDPRLTLLTCIRDPGQIKPTIERALRESAARSK